MAGQPLVVAPALAGQLARLARGLARLRRPHALVGDLARGRRILLEGLGEAVVDDLLDQALDVGVAELGLGLPLELRIGHAHRHDRGQAFAHVVAGDVALEALEEAVGLARSSRACPVSAARNPVRCVPPSRVLMLFANENTLSW